MPRRPLILAQDKSAWIYFSLKGMAGIVSVSSTSRLAWVNLVCRRIPIRIAPGIVSLSHFDL